jgi:hypothetical protein
MFSVVNIFKDLFKKFFAIRNKKDNIIIVRRFPPRKVLRAHQLGLTFALLLALLIICVNYPTVFSNVPWYSSPFIALLFIMGTLFAGPFVFIVGAFLILILILKSSDAANVWGALNYIAQYYFYGYAFGAILATLYNDLVLAHLLLFNKKLVKIAFAFDISKKFNIIKSPDETEEHALLSHLKPVIFYTQEILKGNSISAYAAQIESFIRQAHEDMTDVDQKLLLARLPGTAGDSLDRKLTLLKEKLTDQDVNTIQDVELKIEPVVEKYLKLKEQKLYNFRLAKRPPNPYTIVFVANPEFLTRERWKQVYF